MPGSNLVIQVLHEASQSCAVLYDYSLLVCFAWSIFVWSVFVDTENNPPKHGIDAR